MSEKTAVWDKQPEENTRGYIAFKCYLQQETRRSYYKAAKSMGVSKNTIAYYSKRYNWQARVAAYEEYIYEKAHNHYRDTVEVCEFMKYKQKIEFSVNLQRALDGMIAFIPGFCVNHKNNEFIVWLDHLTNMAQKMNRLIKMTDFSFTPLLLNTEKMKEIGVLDEIAFFDEEEIEKGRKFSEQVRQENEQKSKRKKKLEEPAEVLEADDAEIAEIISRVNCGQNEDE